jgi:hypothetical protein
MNRLLLPIGLPPYSMPPPSLLALIVAKVTLVTVAGKSMAVPDSPISNHDNSQVVVANLIDPTLALEAARVQTEGIMDVAETIQERVELVLMHGKKAMPLLTSS